jgi:hypothetical protein
MCLLEPQDFAPKITVVAEGLGGAGPSHLATLEGNRAVGERER